MISVGPVALALERLFAVLGIIIFMIATGWIARKHGNKVDTAAWRALLVGLVASRMGFVTQNWPAFAREPLSVLYIWQGGFSPLAGLTVAAIFLVLSLRRSPALLPTVMAFIASATAALLATAVFLTSAQRPFPQGLIIRSLAGEARALDDRKGRPFIVNLWATWCGPCQREMPMMIEEAARSPVPILLVNQGEDAPTVQRWLSSRGLPPAHIHLDSNQVVAAASGVAGLPATLFVDGKGFIQELHVGEISRAALLGGLRNLEPSHGETTREDRRP